MVLVVPGFGQLGARPNLFMTVKPQMTVIVTSHPSGSQILELTAVDANYPPSLLAHQAESICKELGYSPNGLQVYQSNFDNSGKLTFLKARFGTFGLIDDSQSRVRLQAIVRGFAGAPSPYTIKGLSIIFDARKGDQKSVREYFSEAVRIQGQQNPNPAPGIEYRVELLSQDPAAIKIPERSDEIEQPVAQKTSNKSGSQVPSWLLPVILGVTAVAFGALVYLIVLRSPGFGSRSR